MFIGKDTFEVNILTKTFDGRGAGTTWVIIGAQIV